VAQAARCGTGKCFHSPSTKARSEL
jgi:hypothetical protein